MAGSRVRYTYTAENLETYALDCDRSNANAVNSSLVLAPATLTSLPKNIKPRYVLYRSLNGKVQRKCYIMLPPTDIDALPLTYNVLVSKSGATGEEVTLYRSFYSGEKFSFPPDAIDTGLTDSQTAAQT